MDVKTAGRTVDLFEVFANARRPLTLSEVANALKAPHSSCFNLLRALEARGYLYAVGGKKHIYPTRKLLDCAEAIANFDPVVPRIQPHLEQICDETGETTILGALQNKRVVYLAVIEGKQTIRYMSHAGAQKEPHATAIGKAIMMTMPQEAREKFVSALQLNAITDGTITDPAALLSQLAAAEGDGYSHTIGEGVADVAAVACPLTLDGISYAVAVAGPAARIEPGIPGLIEVIQRHLAPLRD